MPNDSVIQTNFKTFDINQRTCIHIENFKKQNVIPFLIDVELFMPLECKLKILFRNFDFQNQTSAILLWVKVYILFTLFKVDMCMKRLIGLNKVFW